MTLEGIILYDIASAVADASESRDTVTVDLQDGGWLNVKYEKGADVYQEPETGACCVSGAWCNINAIEYENEGYDVEPVDCDIEKLENMVAEYMNN